MRAALVTRINALEVSHARGCRGARREPGARSRSVFDRKRETRGRRVDVQLRAALPSRNEGRFDLHARRSRALDTSPRICDKRRRSRPFAGPRPAAPCLVGNASCGKQARKQPLRSGNILPTVRAQFGAFKAMSNRAIWNVRLRHVWLASPLKGKRLKKRQRVRIGLEDALNRKAAKAEPEATPTEQQS